jgi:hypothetical protein
VTDGSGCCLVEDPAVDGMRRFARCHWHGKGNLGSTNERLKRFCSHGLRKEGTTCYRRYGGHWCLGLKVFAEAEAQWTV